MKIYKYILSALLIIAVFSLPYGYYQFLRIIVFIGMVFFVVTEFKTRPIFVPLYMGIGILFNPILPIFLSRGTWLYIDIVTAAILVLVTLKPLNQTENGI
jgi:hypothetical protein